MNTNTQSPSARPAAKACGLPKVPRKRLVVLGGGESGVGAAILAKDLGWDVFLSDSGTLAPHYRDTLVAEAIPFEEGGHTRSLILDADEVVKSPGIPPTAPLVAELAAKGVPIVSEIELAGRFTSAKMVCITGSNGKTTTTLLTYHILRKAGVDAGLAGNVGRSLALQVARDPHEVYVIELSSFQLENMYSFKANIAVMLNITPDHLDRYDHCMAGYVNAKFRILRNQTPCDAFIFWKDDPVIKARLASLSPGATLYPFASHPGENLAAWTDSDGNRVHFNTGNPAEDLDISRSDIALPGLHNLYNSMAAGLSACLLDISRDDIRAALSDFEGVEHRLEPVAEIDGVRWINDSKATNVNSTWYALESMPRQRRTVLILGGKDKGNDYSEIDLLVQSKVKAIVAMGVDNSKILSHFGQMVTVESTSSLDEAVQACRRLAEPGDTVLLSPCCASFDLFHSYEERGTLFKDAVRALKS